MQANCKCVELGKVSVMKVVSSEVLATLADSNMVYITKVGALKDWKFYESSTFYISVTLAFLNMFFLLYGHS